MIAAKRKQNISLIVEREKENAQEQITYAPVQDIALRKGNIFCLKQMDGGGRRGIGQEVTIGTRKDPVPVVPNEVF